MDSSDFLDSDEAILKVLRGGRATPRDFGDETEFTKQNIHNRLNVLVAADLFGKVTDGRYELRDNPREEHGDG